MALTKPPPVCQRSSLSRSVCGLALESLPHHRVRARSIVSGSHPELVCGLAVHRRVEPLLDLGADAHRCDQVDQLEHRVGEAERVGLAADAGGGLPRHGITLEAVAFAEADTELRRHDRWRVKPELAQELSSVRRSRQTLPAPVMRNVPPSAVAVIVVNRSAIERWCEPQNLVRQDPHDTGSSCRLSAKPRQHIDRGGAAISTPRDAGRQPRSPRERWLRLRDRPAPATTRLADCARRN